MCYFTHVAFPFCSFHIVEYTVDICTIIFTTWPGDRSRHCLSFMHARCVIVFLALSVEVFSSRHIDMVLTQRDWSGVLSQLRMILLRAVELENLQDQNCCKQYLPSFGKIGTQIHPWLHYRCTKYCSLYVSLSVVLVLRRYLKVAQTKPWSYNLQSLAGDAPSNFTVDHRWWPSLWHNYMIDLRWAILRIFSKVGCVGFIPFRLEEIWYCT